MNLKGKDWRSVASSVRETLVESFPECFMPRGAVKKPLQVGIYHHIRKARPDIPAKWLAVALYDYCGGPKYLRQIVPGVPRYGLDGQHVGLVTDEQAKHARTQLDAPLAFHEASNEAQRSGDPVAKEAAKRALREFRLVRSRLKTWRIKEAA